MPMLPKKKVGLISCSGEELAEGTLSRDAVLRVLERLRPNETVTLCLPLFLAGDDKERAFARFYPTIAIDGCDKRCAGRATAKYSATPTASIVIPEFLAVHGLEAPHTRRRLDAAGERAAEALAEEIAGRVDEILSLQREPAAEQTMAESEAVTATCSCGSSVPVTRLNVGGEMVEVVALPTILEQCHTDGKSPDEMFALVRAYNRISPEKEDAYREAVVAEYAVYCEKHKEGR